MKLSVQKPEHPDAVATRHAKIQQDKIGIGKHFAIMKFFNSAQVRDGFNAIVDETNQLDGTFRAEFRV